MFRELIVPLGILAVLISMIMPLPPVLIDFLIVGNLLFALGLLLTALYVSEPIKLSVLPTIILLATLYRLSLNIATTRSILGTGDGGKVVEAFGTLVIGGSIVVGLVVFLLLTLVQFIVIAKGAERVAEVAARFTLDAMPGKQMSIDADVRAGLISFETAREKRQELQTESRFYGALDGAMKFIKGDAIAGMVITAINIVGGIAIGILVQELEIVAAISRYSVLSVGDGLISQIPALLNSIAAGVVITRVTRGDGKTLAYEICQQLGQTKTVSLLIGGSAILLAFIPAMPTLPFLGIGIVIIARTAMSLAEESRIAELPQRQVFKPMIHPLFAVRIETKLAKQLYLQGSLQEIGETLRQRVFERLGIILPPPEFQTAEFGANQAQVFIRGVATGVIVTLGTSAKGELLTILEREISRHAASLIDDIMTRKLLDYFESVAPDLVSAVVPGIVSVTQLTEVLKGLISEKISIRSLDLILQAIAETGPRAVSERILLEEVRLRLKRVISTTFADTEMILHCRSIEPELDLEFADCEKRGQPIGTDLVERLHQQLLGTQLEKQVLVTSRPARRLVRECLSAKGMDLPVLAIDELSEEVSLAA